MQPDIVALGEPMLEMSAASEGDLSEATLFQAGHGGDTANFCVAAARCGARVGYATRLGDDAFGKSFERLWRAEGIDMSHVERDPDAPTGLYFIARNHGRHDFTYYRAGSAASRMTPTFLRGKYLRGAKLLHVSGISQGIGAGPEETVAAAVAMARGAGVLVSYDPNLRLALWPLDRARSVIHATVPMADILFPSFDDARVLTGLDTPEAIVQAYLELGAGLVVLKLGADGALAASGPAHAPVLTRMPAPLVEAVDASGAGDAFCGAFVAAHLRGDGLAACLRYACAVAALTTTALGCAGAIPTRAALEAFCAARAAV
ncbi:MAG: sugar kinase [Desulfovibrionaceae bacterium]